MQMWWCRKMTLIKAKKRKNRKTILWELPCFCLFFYTLSLIKLFLFSAKSNSHVSSFNLFIHLCMASFHLIHIHYCGWTQVLQFVNKNLLQPLIINWNQNKLSIKTHVNKLYKSSIYCTPSQSLLSLTSVRPTHKTFGNFLFTVYSKTWTSCHCPRPFSVFEYTTWTNERLFNKSLNLLSLLMFHVFFISKFVWVCKSKYMVWHCHKIVYDWFLELPILCNFLSFGMVNVYSNDVCLSSQADFLSNRFLQVANISFDSRYFNLRYWTNWNVRLCLVDWHGNFLKVVPTLLESNYTETVYGSCKGVHGLSCSTHHKGYKKSTRILHGHHKDH